MKDAATAMPTAMDIKDMPDPMDMPSLKGKVSEEEWTLRCQLAATYRLCAMHGWTDLVFTHISARLPDEDGAERFLINPYGVMFDEMTASSLVKIDLEGKICQDTPYNINPAGFTIHSAIHAARHDAGCVINDRAYHDYEGIALELDERERIVNDLGDKSLLMLRNHGTLTLGPNCAIAFLRMYFLENACKTQVFAQAAGTENLHEEDQAMADTVQAQAGGAFTPGYGDNLIWPGLMRKLKRTNPGFDH